MEYYVENKALFEKKKCFPLCQTHKTIIILN